MRIKRSILAVLGGVSLVSLSTSAFAGGCDYGTSTQNCQPGVVVKSGNGPVYDDMTVRIQQPMGHLRSVNFNRAPNVSITRIHGIGPTAALDDAPSSFTDGCHPTSTHYCRNGDVRVAPVAEPAPQPVIAQPYTPPPVMAPPVMARPVMVAPVIAQPVYSPPRTVYVGQGYDASKFQPRQYGENTFTPGIAHVPTSYVDRSLGQNATYSEPELREHAMTAPAAPGIAPLVMPTRGMSSTYGLTLPGTHNYSAAPAMGGVTLPGTHNFSAAPAMGSVTLPGTHNYMAAPAMGGTSMPAPVMQAPMMRRSMQTMPAMPQPRIVGGLSAAPVNSGPVQTTSGLYASSVAPDGTYWEKTSGPTVFGNTIATQVICRRQLPTQTVRPVVGVPTPVPVPVNCAPVVHAQHGAHHNGAPAHYAKKPHGRWTH